MRRNTRWLAYVLCLLLLAQTAAASALSFSFSPGLQQVAERLQAGHAYEIQVQGELAAWPDLNPESLEAFRNWLGNHSLSLHLQNLRGSADSLAVLKRGETPLLTLFTTQTDEQAAMTLGREGQPLTRYLGAGQDTPWHTLLGLDTRMTDLKAARAALQSLGQAALPYLAAYEKPVKAATTIKNVGRGTSQMVYTLKKDEAQAFFEEAGPQLLPLLKEALTALLPGDAEALFPSLDSLMPGGTLTIKRILDKEEQDLGLQITGLIQVNGQARRLTLFGGVAEKGLYLSLKLPATRGNDNLQVQLSFLTEGSRLKGDWRYEAVSGKNRHRASGSITLTSALKEEVERITGKITGTSRVTGEAPASFDFFIRPELEARGDSLTGSLTLQELAGKKVRKEVVLHLTGQPAPAITPPLPMAEVVLAEAGPEELGSMARAVQQALIPLLTDFLMDLPLDTRKLVLHDLGRDQRTQGDSVLPGILPIGDFVVTEETIPTTKEENP